MTAVSGVFGRYIPPLESEPTRQIDALRLCVYIVEIVATESPGVDAILVIGTPDWVVPALVMGKVDTRPKLVAIPVVDTEMSTDREAGTVIQSITEVPHRAVDPPMDAWLEVLAIG
jgi:hypothetical protein